jgi:glutathione S-transferase
MHTLVMGSFNPWGEKARWALDHHRVAYRQAPHRPLVDNVWLRLRMRRWRGPVTVPVLFADDEVLRDSFEIARCAEGNGQGESLFPVGSEDEIAAWNRESDAALAAGRALFVARVENDAEALRECLPGPTPVAAAIAPFAGIGLRAFKRKYGIAGLDGARRARELRDFLGRVRSAIASEYVLGSFSYADIAIAVVLQFVAPSFDERLPLGPARRRCMGTASLAAGFGDLLAWRDELYGRHRGGRLVT